MNNLGTSHFTSIAGNTIHWTEMGQGRPIVFLHGLADHLDTWRRIAPRLGPGFRVLLADLPGHGLSSRTGDGSLEWHAGVIGAWVDSLGLDQFDLVGHSFGGGVAQTLLLTHWQRVGRLALVAPGGLGREVALGVRLLTLPGASRVIRPFLGLGTAVAHRFLGPAPLDTPGVLQAAWVNSRPGTADALTQTARGIADLGGQRRHFLDQAEALPFLPPIALFWGSEDRIIPVSHGVNAVRVLGNARLTIFRHCGHFPHLEVPDPFLNAFGAFLEDGSLHPVRCVVPRALPPKRPWWSKFMAAVVGFAHWVAPGNRGVA